MAPRTRTRKHKILLTLSALFTAGLLSSGLWYKSARTIPDISFPPPVMPSPNAFDTFADAGKAFVEPVAKVDMIFDRDRATILPNGQVKEYVYPLPARDAWLAQNAKALRLLRQGLKQDFMPRIAHPGEEFPPYASYRKLARLLAVESHTRGLHGDWNGAAQSALDIVRLGVKIQKGGDILAMLVGVAVGAIGQKELWAVLPHLQADQLRAAALQLQSINAERVSWQEILMGERRTALGSYRSTMKSGAILQPYFYGDGESGTNLEFKKQQLRLFFMNYGTVIQNYNLYMDTAENAAKFPYGAAPPVPDTPCTISDPTNCGGGSIVPRSRFNIARDEAGAYLLQTAMALEAFRLENGRYPAQLSELTPGFMGKVPADPFGKGGPLLYFLTAQKYGLYSVGPDLKDNKGVPCKNTFITRGPAGMYTVDQESRGDIVAGINR